MAIAVLALVAANRDNQVDQTVARATVDAMQTAAAVRALDGGEAWFGQQSGARSPDRQCRDQGQQQVGDQIGQSGAEHKARQALDQAVDQSVQASKRIHHPGVQGLADVHPFGQQEDGQQNQEGDDDLYPPIAPEASHFGSEPP